MEGYVPDAGPSFSSQGTHTHGPHSLARAPAHMCPVLGAKIENAPRCLKALASRLQSAHALGAAVCQVGIIKCASLEPETTWKY